MATLMLHPRHDAKKGLNSPAWCVLSALIMPETYSQATKRGPEQATGWKKKKRNGRNKKTIVRKSVATAFQSRRTKLPGHAQDTCPP